MNHSEIIYHNPNNIPQADIKKTVIWLHGLGANGYDFVPVVPELGLDFAVKFIFPHAPQMPITVNGGYVMPAWYDILQMDDLLRKVDVAQIEASAQRIRTIIADEVARGVALSNIVIAGFSQGGAVAYHVAMTQKGLAGLLALSTYFASKDELGTDIQVAKTLPILVCHGDYDNVVSPHLGLSAVNDLTALGFAPLYKTYPMAHQVCMPQLMDIGHWLHKVLV